MFLLLYTRKIEHIMQYVEIIFIFHFCQTSNIYISLKQYLLKFVIPCRTFAINDSPPTNKIWAAFAASFQVMSCVLNSVSVSRLQIFLGFPYLFIAVWVTGQSLLCGAGYLLPQGVHVESNRPYHVLFVCLLAPFSSSSNRFQSLRDFFTPSDVEDAAEKKVVKSLDLLESCFVLFS